MTVKVPVLFKVTGPVIDVEVLLVNAELDTVQGLQLGPLNNIRTVDGSKLFPLMVRLNAVATIGGFIEGLRLAADGAWASAAVAFNIRMRHQTVRALDPIKVVRIRSRFRFTVSRIHSTLVERNLRPVDRIV